MAVDVVIDPSWTFSQAFMVAKQAYPGSNIGMKGYRNWVLKAWASAVGRERATRELAAYRALFPSKRAAAAAMGLSAHTFRRLEDHFSKVRSASKPGLTLFLSTKLMPWDQTMLHAYACSVLGMDTDVHVAQYAESPSGASARVRLVGGDPDDLVRVAEHIVGVAWRTQEKAALQAADLLKLSELQDSLDLMRAKLERIELWEQERRDSEGARRDLAAVKRETWAAAPLKAAWDQALRATGAPAVVKATLEAGEKAIAAIEADQQDRAERGLEAKLARQELGEE